MRVRITNTILVSKEAYMYLQRKGKIERAGKDFSQEHLERLEKNFDNFAHDGYKKLIDGSLGGCIGNPENAYEQGRWTSWSCKDMAKMLDEAGLDYKMGEPTEIIDL